MAGTDEAEPGASGGPRPTAGDRDAPYLVGLFALTVATGVVDAVSYLALDHVVTGNMTVNVLFVGFGLTDDHFHELVHDVREVLPPEARDGRLGTALVLSADALRSRLWGSDLDLVAMGGAGVPEQARRTEIFLDCMLAHADRGLSFVLDQRFAHRQTDAEAALRARLLALEAAAGADERATDAWSVVADALARLRPQPVERRVQPGDE